ncbi:tail fiber protein, partial [gut metagenome]
MITKKIKHKDNAGVVHEYDIGADAVNVSEDTAHRFVSDTEKNRWNGKADNAVATQTKSGLMSSEDKKKLDGVSAGAGNYVHPTTAGYKHIPAGGAAGQVLKYKASGDATWGKVTASEAGAIPATEKGAASGVASLDASSKVPASQLPFGEGPSNIFAGDKSKAAYAHSQTAHAPAN